MLYFTSPDDPALCVNKMKGHGNYQSLLGGHFTVSEVDGERKVAIIPALTTGGRGAKDLYFQEAHSLLLPSFTYRISRNISEHYIWRFAQKTLLAQF